MGVKSVRYGLQDCVCASECVWEREGVHVWKWLPVLPFPWSWWSQLAKKGGMVVTVGELGMQISLSALAAPRGADELHSKSVHVCRCALHPPLLRYTGEQTLQLWRGYEPSWGAFHNSWHRLLNWESASQCYCKGIHVLHSDNLWMLIQICSETTSNLF